MRTTLSINDDVLAAAKGLAALQRKSVGEVISELTRQALRAAHQQNSDDFNALLAGTVGIWRHGDGLAWQQNARDEWAR